MFVGQPAAAAQVALGDERAALALRAEAESSSIISTVIVKRVVELQRVDVVGRDTGPRHRLGPALHRRDLGEVGHLVDVPVRLPAGRAEHVDRAAACRSRARSSVVTIDRAAAVGDHAAVELVQRVGDHAAREHVVDRDRVAVAGERVQARELAHADRDLGELLGRRAELVHVPRATIA